MDNGACSYRRFLDGDDGGIAEIVEEYKDGLILFLNGYVKNIHIAEELAEDTFFRLITKRPRFSGNCTFRSWLYAIGRNVAVDHIRRSSKERVTADFDMEDCRLEADLEEAYLKEESRLILRNAINGLSADYRNVLWLVYFEEFSNKEAGKALKRSDRQIKNLLYRAKIALKKKLEAEGFTYEEL